MKRTHDGDDEITNKSSKKNKTPIEISDDSDLEPEMKIAELVEVKSYLGCHSKILSADASDNLYTNLEALFDQLNRTNSVQFQTLEEVSCKY
jgi:hypothetical protein